MSVPVRDPFAMSRPVTEPSLMSAPVITDAATAPPTVPITKAITATTIAGDGRKRFRSISCPGLVGRHRGGRPHGDASPSWACEVWTT
jgi:hypothetical protein